MTTSVEILCLIGALIAFILVAIFVRERQLRKHNGQSRQEFTNEFVSLGIARDIPESVYNHYTASLFFKKIKLVADDSLDRVFQAGERDVEDDALLLMIKLNLKPPSEDTRIQWTQKMLAARRTQSGGFSTSIDPAASMQVIRTVRDMVLWLDWVRQNQPATSAETFRVSGPGTPH